MRSASREASARALTLGDDIVFARGAYRPSEPVGRALLAHELAHVVQARREEAPMIRRALPTGREAMQKAELLPTSVGRLTGAGPARTILVDQIRIPAFKASAHRGTLYDGRAAEGKLRRVGPFRRGSPRQVSVWQRDLATRELDREEGTGLARLSELLEEKIRRAYALDALPADPWVIEIPARTGGVEHHRGRVSTLARLLRRPMWGIRQGQVFPAEMQVDHIVELQLGNWGRQDRWANTVENMELLADDVNGPSGSNVLAEIERVAARFIEAWWAAVDPSRVRSASDDDVRALLDQRSFTFSAAVGSTALGGQIGSESFWTLEAIGRGEHMGPVRVADPSYTGGVGEVRVLLTDRTREIARTFVWSHTDTESPVPTAEAWWPGEGGASRLGPIAFVRKRFATADENAEATPQLGSLWVNVLEANPKWKPLAEPVELPVRRLEGARYAGVLDVEPLLTAFPGLEVKGLSAIRVDSVSFDPTTGLRAHGVVEPDYASGETSLVGEGDAGKPTFRIDGGVDTIEGSVPAEALDPPGPIRVTGSDLAFSSDDGGVRVDGGVDVEIRDLATGRVEASLGPQGFRLAGRLDAETTYFRRATVRLAYDTEQGMSGGAELELETSRLPGIRSGTVSIAVENDAWTVGGSARFRALGVDAQIGVSWSENDGLTIAGRVPIPDGRIPGVRGAYLEGRVTRTPEGELRFGAAGHGEPAIRGLSGSVDVSWDQGVFRVDGSVGAQHRNLSGSVRLGVTNQGLDEDGQPTGEPGDRLSLFGGGRLDVRFGRYLRGSADVEITPTGEMQVRGAIGLADQVELFPRREVSRRLFGLDLEIPIAGIVVLGRGFGVFAFIGGGLDASAGFGPAVLRDTEVSVTFNPARPEDTVVEGSAELAVPADAGLRLFIRAGIGGSLLIADVRGGIEVGGALGVEAEARARLDVRWTPNEGLHLRALAEAIARPVLRLDVTGFAEVNVAVLGTVWDTRYQIAAHQIGSGFELGVRLPLEVAEGQPFSLSFDDVELIAPDLGLEEILHALLNRD